MTRYLFPIFLSAILIAVLVAVNRGTYSFLEFMGPQFAAGFIVGAVFMMTLYGLICWIDPASRPRGGGPATDQQRNRGPLD